MSKESLSAGSEGTVTTKRLEGRIIETVYIGKMSPQMLDEVHDDLARFLQDIKKMDWLIDASRATSMVRSPRDTTSRVVDMFRVQGGNRIAAVVPSGPLRMMASAMSFAFGLPVRTFATRAEALAYLRTP